MNIVWFKRDLRVQDHAALAEAAARGPVLPIYIAELGFWAEPDASARQWEFVAESLAEVQRDLAAIGQPLRIFVGEAVPVLQAIARRHLIAALWSHEETGNAWTYARDLRVAEWARGMGIPWHERRQTGVIRRLTSRDGWAKAWDAEMARPVTPSPGTLTGPAGDWPTAIPTACDLGLAPDPCPERQRGGRRQGVALLDSFLTRRGRDYRWQMSSPVTAFDASSRLSPHLAWGTLALREVAQATATRLRALPAGEKAWRGSLISFAGRQHWHCHFMQKLEDAPRLEFQNLHRAYDGLRPEVPDPARLAAFCAGETGYPFVDACMRALRDHGWLNFRMRAMLVSFASYHLWLPWRATGLHLARQFVDYEPGIHWPQVQMQSGTTGINTMRVYNPVKQGYDQDPAGSFVRRFLPELGAVPDAFLHEPWRWAGASGLSYPPPIVDHLTAARAAREALSGLRKTAAHGVEADAIAQKHGSRRAGLPMTGRKRRGGPVAAPEQLSLKL
ncbi:deoxyribodipyrimidine photolyase [bacterium]|nr:deoxyribodipyrimidine photolyase [bacterium]